MHPLYGVTPTCRECGKALRLASAHLCAECFRKVEAENLVLLAEHRKAWAAGELESGVKDAVGTTRYNLLRRGRNPGIVPDRGD